MESAWVRIQLTRLEADFVKDVVRNTHVSRSEAARAVLSVGHRNVERTPQSGDGSSRDHQKELEDLKMKLSLARAVLYNQRAEVVLLRAREDARVPRIVAVSKAGGAQSFEVKKGRARRGSKFARGCE